MENVESVNLFCDEMEENYEPELENCTESQALTKNELASSTTNQNIFTNCEIQAFLETSDYGIPGTSEPDEVFYIWY